MIWAGITLNGRTYLHMFDRFGITAARYCNEMLEPIVSSAIGVACMSMPDNACVHTA